MIDLEAENGEQGGIELHIKMHVYTVNGVHFYVGAFNTEFDYQQFSVLKGVFKQVPDNVYAGPFVGFAY